eukprot:SAG31_NODE_3101_length_4673_cov_7.286839_3_plen_394_part_00
MPSAADTTGVVLAKNEQSEVVSQPSASTHMSKSARKKAAKLERIAAQKRAKAAASVVDSEVVSEAAAAAGSFSDPAGSTDVGEASFVSAAHGSHDSKKDQAFSGGMEKTFAEHIYGTTKGRLRLAVLQRDLAGFLKVENRSSTMSVLDVGGGLGQMAVLLAQAGHRVLYCDLAPEMVQAAHKAVATAQLLDRVSCHQVAAQDIGSFVQGRQFELVICHAVLEWVAAPAKCVEQLLNRVAPGCHLSLMFFNHHAEVMQNMVRRTHQSPCCNLRVTFMIISQVYGNFQHVANGMKKRGRKLVPQQSLEPAIVEHWCVAAGGTVISRSGVRCFHDYVGDRTRQQEDYATLEALELEYSQMEPYWRLGRYVHFVVAKRDVEREGEKAILTRADPNDK